MNKKGFFFSLDALLALLVTMTLISMLFFYLSSDRLDIVNDVDLSEYSRNVATVIEVENVFGQDDVQLFLNNFTRDETCFNVTLYDASLDYLYSVQKENCVATVEVSSTGRSIVENSDLFFMRIKGWYK
jgi:hypothetical protein